jgi:hypothetical protein
MRRPAGTAIASAEARDARQDACCAAGGLLKEARQITIERVWARRSDE